MARGETLAQVVAASLRQSLRDGVYGCGDRLAEIIIAQEMTVSQNTARDALNILEREGWVVRQPRHGVYVRRFSIEQADELFALRIALESLVLHWLVPLRDTHHKNRLAQIVGEARIQAGMRNHRGASEAIFAFHESLLLMVDRPLTQQALHPLLNQSRLLVNMMARYDHIDHIEIHDRVIQYGEIVTHLRYDNLDHALTCLKAILNAERQTILTMLDLIG